MQPLWRNTERPERNSESWLKIRRRLLAEDENWQVWTDWYEARLRGDPVDKWLELQRITIPYENWEQGPAVVNGRIAELIEEAKARRAAVRNTPDISDPGELEPGSGPRFVLAGDQLDHVSTGPDPDETGPDVAALHTHLQKRLANLAGALAPTANQYPALVESVDDYRGYLNVNDPNELDIPALWMTGVGLMEQARAFDGHDAAVTLTPNLEPETLGLLRECGRLHAGFITSFEQGRVLAERAALAMLTPEQLQEMLEHQQSLVNRLLVDYGHHLTDSARALLEALNHQYLAAIIKSEELARLGFPVVHGVLAALGNTARRCILAVPGFGAVGGTIAGLGDAWMVFLQASLGDIMGIAANVPELQVYFEWLYAHLDEIADNQSSDDD